MKNHLKQRVQCTSCGWAGGRAAGGVGIGNPCFKCGSAVQSVGEPYLEERVLAACPSCAWWGEVRPERVGTPCMKCGDGTISAAQVVVAGGLVIA